jgi:hypothetical protein
VSRLVIIRREDIDGAPDFSTLGCARRLPPVRPGKILRDFKASLLA